MLDAAQAPVLCFLHNFKYIAALQSVTAITGAAFYVLELLTSFAFCSWYTIRPARHFGGLTQAPHKF
jgi:hypothetical protein